ncbi:MAG: hypothetical protein ABIE94_07465 [archaeon]
MNETIGLGIQKYNDFLGYIPDKYQLLATLFIYVILITIYSIFIFKFYRLISKKDIIKMNLQKYNTAKHPAADKFFAFLLYVVEYIIVMPLLVFFSFFVLALFLLLLSGGQTLPQVLLVTGAIIGSIRLTSYFTEDLSRDLAKMFPFTVLAIFLLSANPMSFVGFAERVVELPDFFSQILYYLGFIVILETVVRLFSFGVPKKKDVSS